MALLAEKTASQIAEEVNLWVLAVLALVAECAAIGQIDLAGQAARPDGTFPEVVVMLLPPGIPRLLLSQVLAHSPAGNVSFDIFKHWVSERGAP